VVVGVGGGIVGAGIVVVVVVVVVFPPCLLSKSQLWVQTRPPLFTKTEMKVIEKGPTMWDAGSAWRQ